MELFLVLTLLIARFLCPSFCLSSHRVSYQYIQPNGLLGIGYQVEDSSKSREVTQMCLLQKKKTCDYVKSEAVFHQNLSKIFASIKDFHGFANGFFLRRSGYLSWKAAKYKLCLHRPCRRNVECGLDGVFYSRHKVGMLQASTKTFEFEGGPQRVLMHGIGVFGVTFKDGDGEVRESLMQFPDGCIVFKDGDLLKIN